MGVWSAPVIRTWPLRIVYVGISSFTFVMARAEGALLVARIKAVLPLRSREGRLWWCWTFLMLSCLFWSIAVLIVRIVSAPVIAVVVLATRLLPFLRCLAAGDGFEVQGGVLRLLLSVWRGHCVEVHAVTGRQSRVICEPWLVTVQVRSMRRKYSGREWLSVSTEVWSGRQ